MLFGHPSPLADVLTPVYLPFLIQRLKLEEYKKTHQLEEEDGPIGSKVEEVLQGMNVKRQAYHSNSFIGNHCHKVLEVLSFISVYMSFDLNNLSGNQ